MLMQSWQWHIQEKETNLELPNKHWNQFPEELCWLICSLILEHLKGLKIEVQGNQTNPELRVSLQQINILLNIC